MAMDWKDLYKAARRRAGPGYRQLRRMDADDWLATVGLERRNVAADIFGALGLLALGSGLGLAMGLLFAPKRGEELRRDVNERLRGAGARPGPSEGRTSPPGYAS